VLSEELFSDISVFMSGILLNSPVVSSILFYSFSHHETKGLSVRFEVSTAVTVRSVFARIVHPEDGDDTILRNVGSYKSHTASSPRR
jgi:hypothetical protein